MTVVRSGRIGVSCDLTCASIARTDVKELRDRSFAPTVVKSGGTDANCASTIASCDAIVGTCAETGGIIGLTCAMLAETKPLNQPL